MKVNALDLSPNYAGTLMGITNGISALTGIVAVSSMVKLFKSDADEVFLDSSRTLLEYSHQTEH
jgi:hypothetical protein